jgi:hypothetical protein
MCKCIGDETVQADQAYSSFDTFEEQSNRSDYNFKLEEIEEDTHNHIVEPSNSGYSVPCRCSICARHAS